LEGETRTEKQTLSREEAAAYLGIHVNSLDRSNIPRVRIGGRVLFRKMTLEKLLAGEKPGGSQQLRRFKQCRE